MKPKFTPLTDAEINRADEVIKEIEKRKRFFEAVGICPSCEGLKMMRTTRFKRQFFFWHTRSVSMEPCPNCKGTGRAKGGI